MGPLALVSEVWPFEWTSYYEAEMGRDLRRQLVAAGALADPGGLGAWKRAANEAERAIAAARGGGRPANIDPGYIAGSKLVLASTKDFAHRIYLGGQVFAEVTLRFVRGRCEPNPWTYPDWRSGRYDAFVLEARERWRALSRRS